MKIKIVLRLFVAMFLCIVLGIVVRFYPKQQMPMGEPISIKTPEPEKYHNDCLHPCARVLKDGSFVLIQSPYYGWNEKIENPMIYFSNNLKDWGMGRLLDDTPLKGFNSDPNVFVEDSTVFAFWRAFRTPLCKEYGMNEIVLGGKFVGTNECVLDNHLYIWNNWSGGDLTQCPILMKHNGKYLFYAAWYQYEPTREGKGIAIWEGTSLDNPDFKLIDTIGFDTPLVCDLVFRKKLKLGKKVYTLPIPMPIPKRYDLWHFDLFEYDGKLFMVSCAEREGCIMLSVSKDWKHFKTSRKPLVNNLLLEDETGYRQYYYKPSAIVQNDSLYLFYTANAKNDPNRNQLILSVKAMKDLKY